MRHVFERMKYPLLTILILLAWLSSFCQNDSTRQVLTYDSSDIVYDSASNQLFRHFKEFGDSERQKNLREFTEDTIATRQDVMIELIKRRMIEAQTYIENGLDTMGLSTELTRIKYWYDISSDGVFTNTGTIQTHRNLETSYKIMRELLTRMTRRKSSLDAYYRTLSGLRNTIDSLYKE